jgi:hypothetical protein
MKELSPERMSTWSQAIGGNLRTSDLTWTESQLSDLTRERALGYEPEPRSSPEPPTETDHPRRRKRTSRWTNVLHGGLIVAVLAVLAVAGVSLAVWTAPGKKVPAAAPKVPARNFNTAIYDRFDRDSGTTSIGTTETGQAWTIVGAPWGVQNGQASLGASDGGKRSVAVAGLGTGDGTVQVTMTKVVAGGGLVFRYHDAFNFWSVTAAPKFGTWNIVKVVNGQTTNVGNLGGVSVVDNTTIRAKFQGDHIAFEINGKEVKSVDDPTFATERYVGMIATADNQHGARFDNFVGNVTRAPTTASSVPSSSPSTSASVPETASSASASEASSSSK